MLEQNEQIDKNNTAELEYAGFWLRFRAHIIDGFLIFPIAALFNLVLYDLLSGFFLADKVIESYLELGMSMAGGMFKVYGPLAFLIIISFFPVFITFLLVLAVLAILIETTITYAPIVIIFWIKKQATPGKMAISIKVVDAKTGDKPTSAQCVGRYLAYFASALPFGMGFLWVAFDKRKQGWHDKLAGTVVIWKKNLPSTAENKEDMGDRETQSKAMPQKPDNKEDWEYAGFWVRLGATLIDGIQLLFLIWAFFFGMSRGGEVLVGFGFLFIVFLPVVIILLWMRAQATPGKIAISAKIVDAKTGDKPTFVQFVVRCLAYFASAIPFGMGFLSVAFDERKQGWHDKLAGTVVIRKKKKNGTAAIRKKKKNGTAVIRNKKQDEPGPVIFPFT